MTNTVFEQNINLLGRYNKELAQKISSITELDGNFELKEAKSGDSILYKDSIPLDDADDPVWQALEEYKKLKIKSTKSITFVLGLGLGYTLKELAKRYTGKIILHEPNLDFLRIVFELVDFSEELQKPNIRITNSLQDIENAYNDLFFLDYRPNMLCSNYYLNNQELLKEIKSKVEDTHGIYQSNYRNLIDKNTVWTQLLFKNIPKIAINPDLHILKNKFKNKPAVIISAGPSLDKNIQDLKPYRDNVVVFCVGTALKTALKHEIIPDFAVVVEVNEATKIQLDYPEMTDINLITTTNAYPGVYDIKAKRIFNYHGITKPTSKWLAGILQVSGDYREAGTVALTAFYSAKMLGCNKMIFIGQDLAYTDNKCYSKDSLYSDYKVDSSGNIKAEKTEDLKETLNLSEENIKGHSAILRKNLLYVKGNIEDKVLTRVDLLLFIKYFEDVSRYLGSELTLVNATEGGAYLEGYECISLKEALEKYTSDEILDVESLLKTSKFGAKEIKKRKKIVLNALNEIIKNFNQAKGLVEDAIEEGTLPNFQDEINEVLKYRDNLEFWTSIFKKRKYPLIKPSSEEEEMRLEWVKTAKSGFGALYKKIEYLFEHEPEIFSENLRIVKENYVKIEQIFKTNAYMYNNNVIFFMILNNLIKDFEESNPCLICLSKRLNYTMIVFYDVMPSYIKEIKNLISKIEKN